MDKRYILTCLSMFLIIFLIIAGCGNSANQPTIPPKDTAPEDPIVLFEEPVIKGWTEYENNPVITYSDVIKDTVWNDPSVIKEGDTYRMWLTGGDPNVWPIVVQVYHATSDDGITWDINPEPVLGPSESGWDNLRTETPSVIKVDDTYHLYYSGCLDPCETYNIGHATSPDGINWIKDINNPVITFQSEEPLQWGFFMAAEPTVVYTDKFYLYYVSAKARYPDKGSSSGILLSTSEDGSDFTHYLTDGKKEAVHVLSDNYDYSTHRGSSTPMVYFKDGIYHLYYDIVKDPEGFHQVAISHATSNDGMHFTEVESDITIIGDVWKNKEINGPTVIDDNGIIKMWYAGHTEVFPPVEQGIGYVYKSIN